MVLQDSRRKIKLRAARALLAVVAMVGTGVLLFSFAEEMAFIDALCVFGVLAVAGVFSVLCSLGLLQLGRLPDRCFSSGRFSVVALGWWRRYGAGVYTRLSGSARARC